MEPRGDSFRDDGFGGDEHEDDRLADEELGADAWEEELGDEGLLVPELAGVDELEGEDDSFEELGDDEPFEGGLLADDLAAEEFLEGEAARSRREFIGALSGAVGVALASDAIPMGGMARAAARPLAARRRRGGLPSGYVFHRVFTVGDGTSGLDDVEEVMPGVMINDRSEVIFHARMSDGARAVHRMRISRDRRPVPGRPRLIVRAGQELPGGAVAERIAAGDTNRSGAYVTVIRGAKDFNAVYLHRPGGELRRLLAPSDRAPVRHGRYSGAFGDLDLGPGGSLLVVARYTVPGTVHQGLFRVSLAHPRRGRLLMRTGQHLPGSKAVLTGLGLIERRGRYFVQQVNGRRPRHRRRSFPLEPSGFLLGRVDRGRRARRLLVGSPQLGVRPAVLRGEALVGARVDYDGTAATVVHRRSRHLQLHRHRRGRRPARISRSGARKLRGERVRAISAPVFGPGGQLFYREIGPRSMELYVVRGGERRRLLRTGDRIGNQRVRVFNTGWHTDQVDSRGRLAFQAQLADGRTAIVIGTPV